MPIAISSPVSAAEQTPRSIQLNNMPAMRVSTSTKIGADLSSTDATSFNSFTTTPRCSQMNEMPLMEDSTSTKIGANLMDNIPNELMNTLNDFNSSIDTNPKNSQFTNGNISHCNCSDSNPSVALIRFQDRQNGQPNVSGPLSTESKDDSPQKSTLTTDESLINKLMSVVNECCHKIEEQIELSLSSIESDVFRLLLDDKFKYYFLGIANNSVSESLNQKIRNRMLDEQNRNTNIISNNANQQDQARMSDNANVEFASDNDIDFEQTLVNDVTVIPDVLESSMLELPSNKIADHASTDINELSQINQANADIHINESLLLEPRSTLKSSNVIDITGEEITVAASQKAKDASVAIQLKQNCQDIQTPDFLLEDKHIDAFIKVVRSDLHWDMITVLAMQKIEHYDRIPEEAHRDDIQILFEGQTGPNNVGHYICIHYRAKERKIYVYDSLNRGFISDSSQKIINRRFPQCMQPVNFVEPRTKQPDDSSCGIFATAYATTILLDQDPAEYPLLLRNGPKNGKTLLLRNHLAKIVKENKLSLFPQAVANKLMKLNQNMDVRVLIERLKVPAELNALQHSNDAPEKLHDNIVDLEQTLTNGKRKINKSNADGNLKKKAKLNDAKKIGESIKSLKCDICGLIARYSSHLISHIRTHNGERPFECNICKRRFARNFHLKRHMTTHRSSFAFHCSKCREGFSDGKQCEAHEDRCTIRRFECYLCKMNFRQNRHLADHMIKHTGESPCCSKCQKRFSSKEALRQHIKRHVKLYQFHCPQCRRGFETEKAYKSHENICEIRRYECQLCDKVFYGHESFLLTHLRREHSDEKTLSCSRRNCKELFKTNLKLNEHMQHCQKEHKSL